MPIAARRPAWPAAVVTAVLWLAGCTTPLGTLSQRPLDSDEPLVKGPSVTDVITPFDRALRCLDGRINKESLRFSVGAILDATGKEQVTDGGAGKFITQGAGDVVQSALFIAGATVVNRRDPRIIDNDVRWGLLDPKQQERTTFFVTGSINSLDFLPGSGFDLQVAGVGPRYRQNRILVGLDLSLTEAATGRIVANVALQKQVVDTEDGFGVGRFFGTTLVSADIGGKQREALNLVLRQMLNLATFELLTQVMNPARYGDCMAMVAEVDGVIDNSRSRQKLQQYLASQKKSTEVAAARKPRVPGTVAAIGPATGAATGDVTGAATGGASSDGAPSEPPSPAEHAAARAAAAPAPAASAAALAPAAVANLQAAPAAQNPNFGEEHSDTGGRALQALQLPRSSGNASEALMNSPAVTGAGGNGSANAGGATAAAVLAAVTGAPAAAGTQPATCPAGTGEFPQVTPLLATEPASKLAVRSRITQTLCLADPSGRMVPHVLGAGAEQRFDGRAPWKLWAERLQDIDFTYQGRLLHVPAYVKDRMELLEGAVASPTG